VDPWDRRHTKVHHDLGDVPHQDCQLPSLSDAHHLGLIQTLSKLDELYQLLPVVSGFEALSLRLCQLCLPQSEVPFLLVELDLLLPQHLVEAECVHGAVGVHAHLVVVLSMSSLGLHPFGIKVSVDLDQGLLGECVR
jgi:hypothetical protein